MRHRVPSLPTVLLVAGTITALTLTACGSDTTDGSALSSSRTTSAPAPSTAATSTTPPRSSAAPATTRPPAATPVTPASSASAASSGARRTPSTTPAPARTTRTPAATRLPLDLDTGDASRVVTVVTSGRRDTTALVQRWAKDGSRWRKVGSGIDGYVGSGGVGTAREGSTRTPAGSFTLTTAFGRNSDPGTSLPYVRTTGDDYWISSPGANYNTRQRCASCGYDNGVNEHLREIAPEYDYAVVIDYNTRNAPGGVKAGHGSAFFLHVENGEPTAGCVSIPESRLVELLRWLRPAAHPRILIGTD